VRLTCRRIPVPPLDAIDGVFREQLGPRWAQLRANPAEFGPLIELVELVDDSGNHRFDVVLHRGEDGPVFRAGTVDFVATFSQSSISECDDDDLAAALEAALVVHRRSRTVPSP
jgi:hypothetical protein